MSTPKSQGGKDVNLLTEINKNSIDKEITFNKVSKIHKQNDRQKEKQRKRLALVRHTLTNTNAEREREREVKRGDRETQKEIQRYKQIERERETERERVRERETVRDSFGYDMNHIILTEKTNKSYFIKDQWNARYSGNIHITKLLYLKFNENQIIGLAKNS